MAVNNPIGAPSSPPPPDELQPPVTHSVGKRLVAEGLLDGHELRRVEDLSDENGASVINLVAKLGLVAERELADMVARVSGLERATDEDFPEAPLAEAQISLRFLKAIPACPLTEDGTTLTVALLDPEDEYTLQALQLATTKQIAIKVATPSQIERAIERIYETQSSLADIVEAIDEGNIDDTYQNVDRLIDLASETPVVRLVNLIVNRAIELGASDIHIEPFDNTLKVRYRIDGVLQESDSQPARSTAAVISRIKIMAKLNIAERRLPQDGRIQLRTQGKQIDLRVSTVPVLHGESVVLRVLDKEYLPLDFASLGFTSAGAKQFLEILTLPHGVLLVTGPTGSGKTTTLYTALQKLNTADRKILTVEDPVEYQLNGINQIQVKPQIGLSFANALRSIVRQDPDVIMIGEMRDLETAGIAVQSALTGHLVLSTLHTNDAGTSITRLLDMGIEDYLVTSTVNGILAQRLVRRLCESCRKPYSPLPEFIDEWQLQNFVANDDLSLYQAQGCGECAQTGYRGRIVIMEFMPITDSIRRLILAHEDGTTIEQTAIRSGMQTMKQDGIIKALNGITTFEEVARVTQDG